MSSSWTHLLRICTDTTDLTEPEPAIFLQLHINFIYWRPSAQIFAIMGSWSKLSDASIILLTVVFTSTSASQTKIWIHTVPGHSNLLTCAVYPLSTIVRDMERGCGDGKWLTSYTCFCTESSSHMSTIIASDVLSQCGNQTGATSFASNQATSANPVFHAYCELGVDSGLSVTSLTGESLFFGK